jgi:hypothetical protein
LMNGKGLALAYSCRSASRSSGSNVDLFPLLARLPDRATLPDVPLEHLKKIVAFNS